jgi:hypothetical protein
MMWNIVDTDLILVLALTINCNFVCLLQVCNLHVFVLFLVCTDRCCFFYHVGKFTSWEFHS